MASLLNLLWAPPPVWFEHEFTIQWTTDVYQGSGSGLAATFAAVSVPACSSSSAARSPITANSAGGSSSSAGGPSGMTGGKASGTGGAANNAMGGKASGTGGAANNAMVGKASGGSSAMGGGSNAMGGGSNAMGGGGNSGPAIGAGACSTGPAMGKTCANYCADWATFEGARCFGESTANIYKVADAFSASDCMTKCQQFSEAQLCCRESAFIDGAPNKPVDTRGSCEWASGLGCLHEIPAEDVGEPATPAMPAACGPAVGTIADPYTLCL